MRIFFLSTPSNYYTECRVAEKATSRWKTVCTRGEDKVNVT